MDPITMGISGGVSLLSSLFGGGTDKVNVDMSPLYNAGNSYLSYTKDMFGNPNSSFYNTVKKAQYNSLLDIYASSMRQKQDLLAAQGISPSVKTLNSYQNEAERKAADGANQMTAGLYNQGMGYVNDAYRTNVSAIGQGLQKQLQQGEFNNGNRQNMYQGLGGLGANLLGQYYQTVSNGTPMPSFEGYMNGIRDARNQIVQNFKPTVLWNGGNV